MTDVDGKNPDEAFQFFTDGLAALNWRDGWTAKITQGICDGCGNTTFSVEVQNAAGDRGCHIRISHASKVTGLFHNLEAEWERFVAGDLPEIQETLVKLEQDPATIFDGAIGLYWVPGMGIGIMVGDLERLLRRFRQNDQQ